MQTIRQTITDRLQSMNIIQKEINNHEQIKEQIQKIRVQEKIRVNKEIQIMKSLQDCSNLSDKNNIIKLHNIALIVMKSILKDFKHNGPNSGRFQDLNKIFYDFFFKIGDKSFAKQIQKNIFQNDQSKEQEQLIQYLQKIINLTKDQINGMLEKIKKKLQKSLKDNIVEDNVIENYGFKIVRYDKQLSLNDQQFQISQINEQLIRKNSINKIKRIQSSNIHRRIQTEDFNTPVQSQQTQRNFQQKKKQEEIKQNKSLSKSFYTSAINHQVLTQQFHNQQSSSNQQPICQQQINFQLKKINSIHNLKLFSNVFEQIYEIIDIDRQDLTIFIKIVKQQKLDMINFMIQKNKIVAITIQKYFRKFKYYNQQKTIKQDFKQKIKKQNRPITIESNFNNYLQNAQQKKDIPYRTQQSIKFRNRPFSINNFILQKKD